jgi:hypothetical protein
MNVLGNTDSVSTIKLSNGDTILASKNYGIIQFPFRTASTHYYKLVGLTGIQNAGTQLRRFHDFFNFNTGDVLQFEFTDSDFNFLPPMFMNGHERWDVISSQNFTDSVCCYIKRTYFDSVKYGASVPAITSYSTFTNFVFKDSTKHLANLSPLQEIMTNPYYIYNNGIYGIHKVNYGINAQNRIEKSFGENCPNLNLTPGNTGAAEVTSFPNVFLNKNHRKIVGRKLTEGLGFVSELYNDGDRIYEKCLIGYIKGADTVGSIYEGDPLLIKSYSKDRGCIVFPIPGDKILYLRSVSNTPMDILLLNAIGEKIRELHNMTQLDVSGLPEGIYFLIISNEQFTETKKVIIKH